MAETIELAQACNEYGDKLKTKYPGKFGVVASLPMPDVEATLI